MSKGIFHNYLKQLFEHKPKELKIVVIDNTGFHSTNEMKMPNNIKLLRIPPYTPELNPCEQVWAYIKKRFKNKIYENLKELKEWLKMFIENMSKETIKSITGNHHYVYAFYTNSKIVNRIIQIIIKKWLSKFVPYFVGSPVKPVFYIEIKNQKK